MQLDIAEKTGLPLFLHDRNTGGDFLKILADNKKKFTKGVVHSFTGTEAELDAILKFDKCQLSVGVTGASFKTPEQLQMISKIPLNRLMLETDAPYCGIAPKYAGYVHIKTHIPMKTMDKWQKGFPVFSRNEPCFIMYVASK